ncbi:MAG: VOC family protein [Frankiaceae bacterium]
MTTSGLQTVIYPVSDIAAARELYGALTEVPPIMDEQYYVGYQVNGQDIGLDPNGHRRGLTGPVGYWHVDDIRQSIERLTARGATVTAEVTGVGGGKLIATLTDSDGNVLGLLQQP